MGELRASDLVAAFRGVLIEMDHVDALVLNVDGALAVRVQLTRIRSGHRIQTALVCDGCQRPVRILYARGQAMRCRICLRLRTKQQQGRTTTDWVRRGDREADRLLRLAANPSRRLTPERLSAARELAQQILEADWQRAVLLRDELAVLVAEAM